MLVIAVFVICHIKKRDIKRWKMLLLNPQNGYFNPIQDGGTKSPLPVFLL